MDDKTVLNIISLVKSGITGEKQKLTGEADWEYIYKVAMLHNAVPLLYYGIKNSDITMPPEVEQKFFVKVCQLISICESQEAELRDLYKLFEKNGIDYMPLKGAVIRRIYPKPELRMMSDADILIRKEQYRAIEPMLRGIGFSFAYESHNEYVWEKRFLYLELHRYLLSPDHSDYFRHFGDGWRLAKRTDKTSFCYSMSDEDFYIYLVLHFAKHYRSAGIGIRHITDLWLYAKKNPNMDMEYINSQLAKIQLDTFHQNLLRLINVWFENGKADKITELMTKRILYSGSFGTSDLANRSSALKEKKIKGTAPNRTKKLISTVFPSFEIMKGLFPALKKAPCLLPFMWIYRIVRIVMFKKERIKIVYKNVKGLTDENILKYGQELRLVGLDYRDKED